MNFVDFIPNVRKPRDIAQGTHSLPGGDRKEVAAVARR